MTSDCKIKRLSYIHNYICKLLPPGLIFLDLLEIINLSVLTSTKCRNFSKNGCRKKYFQMTIHTSCLIIDASLKEIHQIVNKEQTPQFILTNICKTITDMHWHVEPWHIAVMWNIDILTHNAVRWNNESCSLMLNTDTWCIYVELLTHIKLMWNTDT